MYVTLTLAEARARGITAKQLRGPAYTPLFQGVYAPAGARLSLDEWVGAARKVLPEGSALTGITALRVRGVRAGQDFPLWFWGPRVRRPGILSIGGPRPAGPTATVEEAYRAVVGRGDLLLSVETGDALVHRGLATRDELVAITPPTVGRQLRAGAESVRETRLRLMLVLAG